MVFMQLDIAQHLFWREMETGDPRWGDVIKRLYQTADELLEEVLRILDSDTTLIVVSDHGAGPLRKSVSINRWLLRQGYLVLRKQKVLTKTFNETLLKTLTLLNTHLSKCIKTILKRRLARIRDEVESYLVTTQIDWTKTKAFTLGEYGGIYINLRAREDQGIVPPEDYDQLRDEIAAELLNLRDPDTGEAVVQHVYRREEIYSGAYVEEAPDLVLDWDYAYDCRERVGTGHQDVFESEATYIPFADYTKTGVHRSHGIFLMYGSPARPGCVEGASLMDIAPTLLHLLGIPVPVDMDGHVLTDALEPDWLAQHPISYRTVEPDADAGQALSYDKNEEAQIRERLRALGYLDSIGMQ
jgi:predicted AlkP superfamily phosphohydrolase/phosphomutase